jgi:hypothetical protein
MARRRRRHYVKSNPLTDTEMVIGSVAALAVVGIGGFLLYQHYNASPSTSALNASGSTSPGGIQSISVDSAGNTTVNGYPVAPPAMS